MHQERGDKYKLIAEQAARKEKERLERDHQGLMEQLFKERNRSHAENSRHEAVLSEIKVLKRQLKLGRQARLDKEASLHYGQLFRQKLAIRHQELK